MGLPVTQELLASYLVDPAEPAWRAIEAELATTVGYYCRPSYQRGRYLPLEAAEEAAKEVAYFILVHFFNFD